MISGPLLFTVICHHKHETQAPQYLPPFKLKLNNYPMLFSLIAMKEYRNTNNSYYTTLNTLSHRPSLTEALDHTRIAYCRSRPLWPELGRIWSRISLSLWGKSLIPVLQPCSSLSSSTGQCDITTAPFCRRGCSLATGSTNHHHHRNQPGTKKKEKPNHNFFENGTNTAERQTIY